MKAVIDPQVMELRQYQLSHPARPDRVSECLRKPLLLVAQPNGCITLISNDFQLKGLDSKLVSILNEATGAYCYSCSVTTSEAHDLNIVRQGFYMEF